MNALNFLRERPLVGWLELLVAPSGLLPGLAAEGRSRAELLGEVLDRVRWEDKEVALNNQGLDPKQLRARKAKVSRLWRVGAGLAEAAGWDAATLRLAAPISALQELLDEWLFQALADGDRTRSVGELLGALKPASLSPLRRYAAIVYARSLVATAVFLRAPRGPLSPTVNLQAMEAARAMFAQQEMGALVECAANILGLVLMEPGPLARLPPALLLQHEEDTPALFLDEGTPLDEAERAAFLASVGDRWAWAAGSKATPFQVELALLELSFADLRMEEARRHAKALAKSAKEFPGSVDEKIIRGYCTALGLDDLKAVAKAPSVSERLAATASLPSTSQTAHIDQIMKDSYASVPQSSLAALSLTRSSPALVAGEAAALLRRGGHLERRLAGRLGEGRAWALFVELVTERLNRLRGSSEARLAATWLIHFARLCPERREELPTAFPALAAFFAPQEKRPSRKKGEGKAHPLIPGGDLLRGGSDLWRLTATADFVEMKALVHRLGQLRSPCRYSIPPTLEEVFNLLPGGALHDFVAFVSAKAGQLSQAGLMSRARALIQNVLSEGGHLRDQNIQGAFTHEILRMELVKYHEMVYRTADMTEIQRWRLDLTPRVKQFIALVSSLPAETVGRMEHFDQLFLLVTTFILNMGEFSYIMASCGNFRPRYMDVGKMLGAFCLYPSGKEREKLAEAFSEFLTPTMAETGTKRALDGSKIPAANLLISRAQFRAMVGAIKEPGAISLLLAFLARLFNALELTGAPRVFAEQEALLPKSGVSATLCEEFVDECLALCLHNALLCNPSNAFNLRTAADFALAHKEYQEALLFYIQAMQVSSSSFHEALPENVVEAALVENAMRCCRAIGAETEAALMAQLHPSGLVDVALKWTHPRPTYFPLIWDSRLAEILVGILDKQDSVLKEEMAVKAIGVQELNCHNAPEILERAKSRRQRDFFERIISLYY